MSIIKDFINYLIDREDVDDRTSLEKYKMEKELFTKTGLTMRQLDKMSYKDIVNFKRK